MKQSQSIFQTADGRTSYTVTSIASSDVNSPIFNVMPNNGGANFHVQRINGEWKLAGGKADENLLQELFTYLGKRS